ncbi:MAG TPA: chondroitinase-B domain-containing protein, partial [Opitutaceae bacterium]|nr:chondroitinase-B domain-containing protein [Opitutaceae bacterium]
MQIPHKTPPSFDQRSAPVAPSAPSLKALTTLVSLAALALTASAATINVNSNASLASALSGANPGDTIVLANGSYAGFTVSRSGTASAPITVEAANQGGATISSGFIHLAQNSYVIIQGLTLTTPGATATIDGSSGSAAIWLEAARNCRVSRCTFKLAGASGTQWVTVAGASDSNRIDHCEFGPNSSTGTRYILARGNPTIPGVTPPSDRTSWANGNGPVNPNMSRNTRIDHNYFHDKSGTGETIGLGAIGVTGDYQNTNSLVEYNLFVNCDSDPEIITTKSSSNIIRYNTVRTCSGMFSLRAGNGSSIYGNFMLQGRKSGTGGIKIYEKNHTIFNNYIDSADQYPILIGAGDSYSGGHFSHAQVFDALIVHNTVVNLFDRPVIMGHGSTDHLPPTDVVFANNIIQGTAATLFTVSTAPSNPTYSDNIIYPNGPSGFSAGQFEVVNPQFTTVNGLQKLSSGSPAINAANQNYFSFVTDDMDGQTRNSHRDIGADEFSSAPIVRQPLTTGDVGPLSDLTPQAAAPAFSPGGGTYTGAQSVTITSATSGTSIRYTTDGSAPS